MRGTIASAMHREKKPIFKGPALEKFVSRRYAHFSYTGNRAAGALRQGSSSYVGIPLRMDPGSQLIAPPLPNILGGAVDRRRSPPDDGTVESGGVRAAITPLHPGTDSAMLAQPREQSKDS